MSAPLGPDERKRRMARAASALKEGHTMGAAAALAGVTRQTLYEWSRESDALRQARAQGTAALEASVLRDAMTDGRLALEVLSRRSKAWQKREQVRHSGRVDASVSSVAWPKIESGPVDGF